MYGDAPTDLIVSEYCRSGHLLTGTKLFLLELRVHPAWTLYAWIIGEW